MQATPKVMKRRLFRVKEGRALIFPEVPADPSNPHLWARAGQVVDATHPVLLAIVERVAHNVTEIEEKDIGTSRVVERLHPSVKAAMKEHDQGKGTKAGKLAAAATEKAKGAGVDPSKLPKLTEA